jgi:hypothetical protein
VSAAVRHRSACCAARAVRERGFCRRGRSVRERRDSASGSSAELRRVTSGKPDTTRRRSPIARDPGRSANLIGFAPKNEGKLEVVRPIGRQGVRTDARSTASRAQQGTASLRAEDGLQARGVSRACESAKDPKNDANSRWLANCLGLPSQTDGDPRQFAYRPAKCCERRTPCAKTHATEHTKPPGFPPRCPFATRARRGERSPSARTPQHPVQCRRASATTCWSTAPRASGAGAGGWGAGGGRSPRDRSRRRGSRCGAPRRGP